MPVILTWGEIQDRFTDSLLLGNGASMAVHADFGYGSLFETARLNGHITPQVAEIFDQFGVNDFELVLRRLWQAKLVIQALEIPPGRVDEAYAEVRNALIATVRDAHVRYEDAEPHLAWIYPFMARFTTVASLNYDLIVYWAAMMGNRDIGRHFKDGFINGVFCEDWQELRQPYRGARGATLFFYPHGNLALTRTQDHGESKIGTQDNGRLLDAILQRWEQGTAVPLFVCEGTSAHKKQSIEGSSYLQRVYREVISSIGPSLVIYGWSLSEQDQHIVNQLRRRPPQRVAVSVRGNDQAFAQRAEEALLQAGIEEVVFFDSASPGCWNNPTP
ncbi:DUF4917 family protein [Metapseudomonas resinovorans]|uniref:DUF4917 domain-containing protein n=1 Tax=Metapseudomonas resinovorans NBRC 106553 TaxID=1245471 RepID=S6AXE4_METRE|nr:DUF4917 family protein [Pseudomonas resinovorans]BAN51103.1 hypothetical protein PCA10_53710 [Pseudomonas resinovorans NBRC 106553]